MRNNRIKRTIARAIFLILSLTPQFFSGQETPTLSARTYYNKADTYKQKGNVKRAKLPKSDSG